MCNVPTSGKRGRGVLFRPHINRPTNLLRTTVSPPSITARFCLRIPPARTNVSGRPSHQHRPQCRFSRPSTTVHVCCLRVPTGRQPQAAGRPSNIFRITAFPSPTTAHCPFRVPPARQPQAANRPSNIFRSTAFPPSTNHALSPPCSACTLTASGRPPQRYLPQHSFPALSHRTLPSPRSACTSTISGQLTQQHPPQCRFPVLSYCPPSPPRSARTSTASSGKVLKELRATIFGLPYAVKPWGVTIRDGIPARIRGGAPLGSGEAPRSDHDGTFVRIMAASLPPPTARFTFRGLETRATYRPPAGEPYSACTSTVSGQSTKQHPPQCSFLAPNCRPPPSLFPQVCRMANLQRTVNELRPSRPILPSARPSNILRNAVFPSLN